MLVLARNEEESIIIQEDGRTIVELKVCKIQPSKVRLGFTAEKKYKILRKELVENV